MISEEYFKIYTSFLNKYDYKTILLFQIGKFYEIYSTNEIGYDLKKLSELLNVQLTKKDKSISSVSIENPYLIGFPIFTLQKYSKILLDNQFTIVIYNEVSKNNKIYRELSNVLSIGTNLELSTSDSNFISCLYIKNFNNLIAIGCSSIDLSTGENNLFEIFSNPCDKSLSVDETFIYLNTFNPKEIILISDDFSEHDLIDMFELYNKKYFYLNQITKNFDNINYQNLFLEKIFKKQKLSLLEYLNIEKYVLCNISYISLLQFSFEHNPIIINNIKYPCFYNIDKNLCLNNNTIYQLNIVETYIDGYKNKSVFHIIDKTYTPIGKRFLKYSLLNPIQNVNELNKRYSIINDLKIFDLKKDLQNICDIERLSRKISLFLINPLELFNIYNSFIILLNMKLPNSIKIDNENNMFLKNFITHFDNLFVKNKMFFVISESFFKPNLFPNIDYLQNKINNNTSFIQNLCNKIKSSINENVKLEHNDRDGYFISMTKRRYDLLKEYYHNGNKIIIDNITISFSDIEAISNKNNIKLKIKKLNEINIENTNLLEQLLKKINEQYKFEINNINKIFNFDNIIQYIGYLDFLHSAKQCSLEYNYCSPKIIESNNSFLIAKQLRHCIIERFMNIDYIANDVEIGKSYDGIMLYGLNSSGKTSLVKSIGIAVILAQIGYYVPAKEFTLSIFKDIYTRISGNDNLFKAQSSFSIEMNELKSILKRCNKNSLVLSDEICRGTEQSSANIIVLSMIEIMSKNKTKFISASHLHEIPSYIYNHKLINIKCFHLDVFYDDKLDKLMYNRKLKDGSGNNFYGLTVCKFIINDDNFFNIANTIKNELYENNLLVNNKSSHFNKDIIVDSCQQCGYKPKKNEIPLETHHIKKQKCANIFGLIDYQHKNKNNNLMVLCKNCHDKITFSK